MNSQNMRHMLEHPPFITIKMFRYCVIIGNKRCRYIKKAEEEITFKKAYELMHHPIHGRYGMTHFFNIHKFIFGDIYAFAGRIRYEDISNGMAKFCTPSAIKKELTAVLEKLKADNFLLDLDAKEYFNKLTYYMA